MKHNKILDEMIANSCISRQSKDREYFLMTIDLHCNVMWIVAQKKSNKVLRYNILFAELQGMKTSAEMSGWIDQELAIDWREY
jgi:hypothetical protein